MIPFFPKQRPSTRRQFLCLVLMLVTTGLSAQSRLSGRVTGPQGDPLPFVNLVINNDPQWGVSTDIDGRFEITASRPVRSLRLTYVGYRDTLVSLDTLDTSLPLRINLRPQAYDFSPVEVIAGVNPADVIMRKVIRNRHRNDPERLDSYRCRSYNKVVMSWLPRTEAFEQKLARRGELSDSTALNKRQIRLLQLMESAGRHHLLIMESLTERRYRRPAAYAETVLANRVSGLSEAPFTALANDVQPFSFYQEQVMLLDKAFLNPVSPGSPERYFFHLEDTLYRQRDTVYLITFHPRKNKNFNGLKGLLYINTHHYAVQNIIAEPADTGLLHFRIEQLYERPDGDRWFPAQLNYEIRLPKYPHPQLGVQVSGRSYIREVVLNTAPDPAAFKQEVRYVFADSAHEVLPEVWPNLRAVPLDRLEERTYEIVDSVGKARHFDRWLDRLDGLGRGRWPLGPLDLSLPHLLQLNQFEELRLGLGLFTSEKLASWFTLGAYAGYGLKDETWKYGAAVHFFPDWDRAWEWQWYYRRDLSEAGGGLFPLSPNLVSRRFFATSMDREERFGTFLRFSPRRYLQIGLATATSRLEPQYSYRFRKRDQTVTGAFRLTEAAVHLHYAYGQSYRRVLGARVPDGQERAYPELSLTLGRGFGAALGGDYPYWQAWGALDQRFRLRRLGKTSLRLEIGRVWGEVPRSRLYSTAGIGRDFQWLTLGNVFQTMNPYEFLSDRYAAFFFRQEFGSLLFKTQWLQPLISLEHHFIIGNLSNPERHEGFDFRTLELGFSELGLIIDNLIRINYLNFAYLGLGGGTYYRYGAYHLPGGVAENLAFRLSLALDF